MDFIFFLNSYNIAFKEKNYKLEIKMLSDKLFKI